MGTQKDLNKPSATQAAQVVWAHWQLGQVIQNLPEECRPLSTEQGYEAQAQLTSVSGRSIVGWKIAATSANGGNCYNCHQIDKKEISFGTIGPSLYQYGKLRGVSDPASEAARPVADHGGEAREASIVDEALLDDAAEDGGVDVAAADDHADVAAGDERPDERDVDGRRQRPAGRGHAARADVDGLGGRRSSSPDSNIHRLRSR